MVEVNKKLVGVTSIKKGSLIIMDNAACKVTDVQISRPGKHGHSKCRISAVGILDDKKRIEVMPGSETVEVPIIDKKDAQVLSVAGDYANVMDMTSFETFDLKIPEELKDKVVSGMTINYWIVLGERILKGE